MAISIFETSNFVEDDFGYREIVSYKGATDASQQLLSVQPGFFCFLSSLFSFEVVGTALPCYHHRHSLSQPSVYW